MPSRVTKVAACALSLALTPGAVTAQIQFRTSAEALQFQVVVADERGAFVKGLGPDDLRVTVNGREREIVDVHEIDLGVEGTPELPDQLPVAGWRQFVLLFDAAFNSPRGVRNAQEAALAFLDGQLAPTDLVSVVTFDIVSGVKVRVPLTRDRRQVRAAIEELGLTQATRTIDRPGFLVQTIVGDLQGGNRPEQGTETGPGGEAVSAALADVLAAVARAEFDQYRSWVETYVSQIAVLGQILEMFRGRKHVLFFTTGFEDRVLTGNSEAALGRESRFTSDAAAMVADNPEETFGSADVRAALDDAIERLREADTVLHMVDVAGVGGGRGDDNARFRSDALVSTDSGRSSLTVWAEGTGGSVVWNTNRLADALADIERGTRQFYVVAISRRAEDGDTIDLDVEATRPGARVTAAPSRFAPPPAYADMTEAQRQSQLAELVTKGVEESGMSFDLLATTFPGRNNVARVPIVLEVPWEQLEEIAAARGDDRVALDVIAYVITGAGTMIDLTDRHVELDLRRMRDRMEGLPLRLYDLLWAWPGAHSVRVVVRDAEVGMTAAATAPLTLAAAREGVLAVGRPVFLDTEHPGLVMRTFDEANPPVHKADGPIAYPFAVGDRELTPMARAELEAGALWEVLVPVSNLARHPFTGQTQFTLEVDTRGGDGSRTPLPQLTLLGKQPHESGGETLWLRIEGTDDVPDGFRELHVSVTDAVAGTTAAGVGAIRVR